MFTAEQTRYWWNKHRGKIMPRIIERDGAKCRWCGSTENLTIDHIIPIVKGGTNDDSNLQVLCYGCNVTKGERL